MRRAAVGLGLLVGLLLGASSPGEEPSARAVLADLPILAANEPNRIVIDLAPEGRRPLRMILDTGASTSFVTPRAARELGIGVRRLKSTPYRRATRLGRDLQLWVDVASSDTAARTGWEYAMLGGNFLSHYVVEIDFHAQRVRFLDPERYAVPEPGSPGRGVSLPLRVVAQRPLVEIDAGAARLPVLLDTGAPGTLILSAEWAERAGAVPEPSDAFPGELPTGAVRLEPARLARLRLGPFEERDVPIVVAPRGLQGQAAGSGSVLGVELLRRFVVRIDYARQRLWLHDPNRVPTAQDDTPAAP